jgi:hypothetical protein
MALVEFNQNELSGSLDSRDCRCARPGEWIENDPTRLRECLDQTPEAAHRLL